MPDKLTETIDRKQSFGEALLAALVAGALLDGENAERARRAHERASGSMVDVLVRLGLCGERDVAKAVAALTGCPLIGPEQFPEDAIDKDAVNAQFLREAKVIPIGRTEDSIVIAAADPTDAFTAHALELAFGCSIAFAVASGSDIEDAVLRLHGGGVTSQAEVVGTTIDIANADFVRLQEAASEAPIVRFVERLIARAAEAGASDIHIEPLERTLRVRMRVDGVLREEEPAPLSAAPAIVSRIKILARLDIAERRLPQDGALKINVRGREIDLRIATGPVTFGESVVIRLLDRDAVELDLAKLGFDARTLEQLRTIFARPSGMVLVTGPTGSGKSTTLYAGLSRLNTAERKIITIEDPVEYKIEGLNQFQVKPDIGLDFARVLRAILRHDPDIVMVGEIRDGETARIAMQAALTGHLVLSTLHTNDAASAVTRLLDMGVEDYLVASTVTGVLAQRLVRTLCESCKQPADALPSPALSSTTPSLPSQTVFRAVGCPSCGGTGYRGRSVISELLVLNEPLRRAILKHEDAGHLRAIAIESGMEPLYDNGLKRVGEGRTTFEEVARVAQDLG
jgi:general secretion pathway protein E